MLHTTETLQLPKFLTLAYPLNAADKTNKEKYITTLVLLNYKQNCLTKYKKIIIILMKNAKESHRFTTLRLHVIKLLNSIALS